MKRINCPLRHLVFLVASVFIMICFNNVHVSNAITKDLTPQKEVKRLVNQVLQVLKDPKLKGEDKKEIRRKKLRDLVQQLFDLNDVSNRVLGRYRRKFNKDQFNEFKDLFSKLLESIYLTKIEHYSGEKVIFEEERMLSPTKVAVPTKIIKNDTVIPVEYRLVKRQGKWTGYDVVIEGVSLVKNYRSQFYQILKKKDVESLLAMMKEKVDALKKKEVQNKKS